MFKQEVADYLSQLLVAIKSLSLESIEAIAKDLDRIRESGNALFILGNGGSYSNASHLTLHLRESGLFAVDLMADLAHLTALSNDLSYGETPARRLAQEAVADDGLLVISGSGNSRNVLLALRQAKDMGLKTLGLLGMGGGIAVGLCDVAVVVESDNYGIIEDLHSCVIHNLKDLLLASEGQGTLAQDEQEHHLDVW